MTQHFMAAGIAALLVGCAGATPAGESGEVPTGDFETLRARESTLPKAAELLAPDGSFRAQAEGGLSGALEKVEGAWYGTFDIGTDEPAECLFFAEEKDAATSLVALAEGFFSELGKTRKLGKRQVLAIGGGAVGPSPYLGIDWLVVLDSLVYQVKFKFANKQDRAIYCSHGETGYAKSFDTFFRSILRSFSAGGETAAQYRDVSLISLGELTVGYQTLTITRDDAGDIATVVNGSTLVPAAADTVIASDDYNLEWSRPDGTLINQVSISSDGTNLTQLELGPSRAGWNVSGKMQGKTVARSFQSELPLLSTHGEYRLIRRVASGEFSDDVSYARWMGPVHPTAPTPHVARSLGGSRVQVDAGPIASEVEVDQQGIARGTIRMGRVEMDVKRVYVEGEL